MSGLEISSLSYQQQLCYEQNKQISQEADNAFNLKSIEHEVQMKPLGVNVEMAVGTVGQRGDITPTSHVPVLDQKDIQSLII